MMAVSSNGSGNHYCVGEVGIGPVPYARTALPSQDPVTIYLETLTGMNSMVSRIRRTLTVSERAAAFEHTNAVARTAADEERRKREAKTERLRKLRLASEGKA
jgi:hypothetical protein